MYKLRLLIESKLIENYEESVKQSFQKGARSFSEDKMGGGGFSKEERREIYSRLDMSIVIKFEVLLSQLEKSIEKCARTHIEFWAHLEQNMVDLNLIHKLGLQIIS